MLLRWVEASPSAGADGRLLVWALLAQSLSGVQVEYRVPQVPLGFHRADSGGAACTSGLDGCHQSPIFGGSSGPRRLNGSCLHTQKRAFPERRRHLGPPPQRDRECPTCRSSADNGTYRRCSDRGRPHALNVLRSPVRACDSSVNRRRALSPAEGRLRSAYRSSADKGNYRQCIRSASSPLDAPPAAGWSATGEERGARKGEWSGGRKIQTR